MKPVTELIRELLEFAEKNGGPGLGHPPIPDGYTEETVHWHVGFLAEDGYMIVKDVTTHGDKFHWYMVARLTPAGHAILETMRSEPSRDIGF